MSGNEPFSQREGQREDVDKIIRKSELSLENDERTFLAEVHLGLGGAGAEKGGKVRVGAAIIQDRLPEYLAQHEDLKEKLANMEEILYLEVLIAVQRQATKFRGAEATLVEGVKSRAKRKGKKAVYVDVWASNARRLNAYYERLGFGLVGDFGLKRRNGSVWPGSLYLIEVRTMGACAFLEQEKKTQLHTM